MGELEAGAVEARVPQAPRMSLGGARGLAGATVHECDQGLVDADRLAAVVAVQRIGHHPWKLGAGRGRANVGTPQRSAVNYR